MNTQIKKFECRMTVEKAAPAIAKLFKKGALPIGGIIRFTKGDKGDMVSRFEHSDVEVRIRKVTNRYCSVQVSIPNSVIEDFAYKMQALKLFGSSPIINIKDDGENTVEEFSIYNIEERITAMTQKLTDEYLFICNTIGKFCEDLPPLPPIEKKKPVEKPKQEKKKRR